MLALVTPSLLDRTSGSTCSAHACWLMNTFWWIHFDEYILKDGEKTARVSLTQVWSRTALCPLCFCLCILMTLMRLQRVFNALSQAQLVPLWRPCCMLMIWLWWLTILMQCRPCSMLNRLYWYAQRKHFIVNTAKSEMVHFNSFGSNVLVFNVGRVPLAHKILLSIRVWCFTGTWAWLCPLSTQLVLLGVRVRVRV